MIKRNPGEIWKPLQFPGWKQLRKRYAVSSHGRTVSYNKDVLAEGKLLNGSLTTGYRTLNLHRPGNKGTIYIHREIAKLFCHKKSSKHKYVIHLNHKKTDNNAKNLQWATLDEMAAHQQSSPVKIAYKEQQRLKASTSKGLKLTPAQVKTIKKIISDPKRKFTYKQLAQKYKVSEMTLYRIRSGENWGLVPAASR